MKNFLLFLMLLLGVQITFAATTVQLINGIYYTVDTTAKTAEVTASTNSNQKYSGQIDIPEMVTYQSEVYTVNSIGSSAFSSCGELTSVIIPNSITSIGNRAFENCSGLTSIEISGSVTSIGNRVFENCSSLTSIEISSSVTSIGNFAFNGCESLKNLRFDDGEDTLTLGYNTQSTSNTINGKGLFYDCPLETVYLGRELSYKSSSDYGYSPFYNIKTLTQVTIGNSVSSIGNSAFSSCSGMTSLEIPKSITSIGNRAFENCSGLTSIEIPSSVTSIGNFAFNGCNSLIDLRIEDGEDTLTVGYNTQSTSSSNGKGLFYDCPLEKLYLGRDLSYNEDSVYGYSPFYYKSTLIQVTIGNSVTSIGDCSFRNCNGLTSVKIPNSVTSIGKSAFRSCSGLTSIEIPNSVTSIGNFAFNGCNSLIDLRIEDGEDTLTVGYNTQSTSKTSDGKGLFYDCPLETVYLGRDLSYKSSSDYGYSPFYGITKLIQATIGNSVTSVGSRFLDGTALSTITLGETVNSIEDYAFPSSLRIVTSLNPTPPTIKVNTFNSQTPKSGTLMVPESALASYQYAAYWNEFLRIEAIPDGGSGDSSDQNSENIFNSKIDKYIYMSIDEEQTFTNFLPSDVTAFSWESSDDNIVEVTKKGKAEAHEYGNVIIRALDSMGAPVMTLGVFICPTVKIHYGNDKTYEHHVIYHSIPTLYITAPEGFEITNVWHDGENVTTNINNNGGYYIPSSPITDNTIISVELKSTAVPGDLNGDGVLDPSDLNWLIEQMMNF